MELRDRIIKAGLEVFGEHGYEKATIAQIVARADSSKGGFYHHFVSKKEVLDEITKMFMQEIIDSYNNILEDTSNETIYLLNNVFATVNNFKKQRLGSWKELVNLYSHEDSLPIRQNMWFQFIDISTDIYERLILKGIDEGLFTPSSPKALASMWSQGITRLYGKINEIVTNDGDEALYDEFISQAQFLEDTINYALNAGKDVISIKKSALEYLDMAIDMMHKVNGK